jgi:putative ABC transport system ATP-binding protein
MAISSPSAVLDLNRPPHARLWQILNAERKDLTLVAVYEMAVGIFSLVVPIAAQSLVNTVVFNFLLQPIVVLAAIVVAMLGVASLLKLVQTAVVETIQTRIFTRVSLDLAYRLSRIRTDAYDGHRGTELVNRFFEVVTIQKGLALMLVDGLAVILQAIIGMTLLAFYHPLLLAFDIVLMVCIFLVIFLPSRKGTLTSIKESKAKYKVVSWLEEIARNPVTFKLAGGPNYALMRADEVTSEYLSARRSHFVTLMRQIRGTLLVHTVVSGLFLGLGSYLVIKKQLTLGQLVASEIIVTMVLSGFAKFGKYLETYYDLVAATDKIGHLFDLPLEQKSAERITIVPGPMSFKIKKVNFRYSENGPNTLTGIDLDIAPGEHLGIVGGNGTGKSTLFDLIIGLRTPTSGVVELSGYDLRDVDLEEIRSHIALVRQVEIIDGTVLDNIRLGRADITLNDVRQALAKVELLDEVSALSDGLSTDLSGSLNPLSAGQAQRLMIARAIAGNPKLLLLDEALDDMDGAVKNVVLQTLFSSEAPWTAVIVSHDPVELSSCSRIVRLKNGKLYLDDEKVGGQSL